jgi:hypothetical protein
VQEEGKRDRERIARTQEEEVDKREGRIPGVVARSLSLLSLSLGPPVAAATRVYFYLNVPSFYLGPDPSVILLLCRRLAAPANRCPQDSELIAVRISPRSGVAVARAPWQIRLYSSYFFCHCRRTLDFLHSLPPTRAPSSAPHPPPSTIHHPTSTSLSVALSISLSLSLSLSLSSSLCMCQERERERLRNSQTIDPLSHGPRACEKTNSPQTPFPFTPRPQHHTTPQPRRSRALSRSLKSSRRLLKFINLMPP